MKILVLGDGIIDHYVYGISTRQSPEDPTIPVVDFVEEEYLLGGCLNAASNIKSLSRIKDEVYVSSIISRFTANLLKQKNIIYDEVILKSSSLVKPHTRELIKTRIIESETHKQQLRLDNRLRYHDGDLQRYKNKCFFYNIKNFDAVVVSDYNKGLVDDSIVTSLSHEDVKCPIFIDTKNTNISRWMPLQNKEIFFKLNQKEWDKVKWTHPENYFTFIITQGENGAVLLNKSQNSEIFTSQTVKNANAIGAGDVFLASLVMHYVETYNLQDAIRYANKVAQKSVEKFGTCYVSRNEVI
jgi:D-beta-D-heptose 7-phosphate kinase/D-beta-D-heptose 1-phosphate adenosyltransferase